MQWWMAYQNQAVTTHWTHSRGTRLTPFFFTLMESGLRGDPILETWCEFEHEVMTSYELQMDQHLQLLPIRVLLPLLLLIFPSICIVLLGPWLVSFQGLMLP